MFTNELKKGARVQLRNGWFATIEDNLKGNTRLATVEGYVTEMGSVYSHDIMAVLASVDGDYEVWDDVQHTPAQEKLRKRVNNLLG
jgi:hypothetical protein